MNVKVEANLLRQNPQYSLLALEEGVSDRHEGPI